MTKLKTPLLSLDAHGTLANSLTFQKTSGSTFVRKKPIPAYTRTLPQLYQRWLYEDYAYLWRQQSIATKQSYQSTGSRYHLTGFQYWMRYCLRNLPNIKALYRCDEASGNALHDFSSYAHNGIIFGASPAIGRINGGQLFDGINDTIRIRDRAWLNPSVTMTIEFFFTSKYPTGTVPPFKYLYQKGSVSPATTQWFCYTTANKLRFMILIGGVQKHNIYSSALVLNKTVHYAYVYNGSNLILYEDGVQFDIDPVAGAIGTTTWDFYLSNSSACIHGILDHFILYDRALDLAEIQRHAARRYPP